MPMTAEEMIDNIPRFESSDGQIISFSDRFLKHKLHNALANPSIINLARGEGRSTALNDIVFLVLVYNSGHKKLNGL